MFKASIFTDNLEKEKTWATVSVYLEKLNDACNISVTVHNGD